MDNRQELDCSSSRNVGHVPLQLASKDFANPRHLRLGSQARHYGMVQTSPRPTEKPRKPWSQMMCRASPSMKDRPSKSRRRASPTTAKSVAQPVCQNNILGSTTRGRQWFLKSTATVMLIPCRRATKTSKYNRRHKEEELLTQMAERSAQQLLNWKPFKIALSYAGNLSRSCRN